MPSHSAQAPLAAPLHAIAADLRAIQTNAAEAALIALFIRLILALAHFIEKHAPVTPQAPQFAAAAPMPAAPYEHTPFPIFIHAATPSALLCPHSRWPLPTPTPVSQQQHPKPRAARTPRAETTARAPPEPHIKISRTPPAKMRAYFVALS